jgi:peptide/nickel transport system ATP-binding protein
LQVELGLTYLFIAHDLAVVRHISHQVAVMYLGRFVEQAPSDALFNRPRHPYTHSLLQAVPRMDGSRSTPAVTSEPPSPFEFVSGCAFHPRCRWATDVCRAELPALTHGDLESSEHPVACHHADLVDVEANGAPGEPVVHMPGR